MGIRGFQETTSNDGGHSSMKILFSCAIGIHRMGMSIAPAGALFIEDVSSAVQ
jgi:hypothetical protein